MQVDTFIFLSIISFFEKFWNTWLVMRGTSPYHFTVIANAREKWHNIVKTQVSYLIVCLDRKRLALGSLTLFFNIQIQCLFIVKKSNKVTRTPNKELGQLSWCALHFKKGKTNSKHDKTRRHMTNETLRIFGWADDIREC